LLLGFGLPCTLLPGEKMVFGQPVAEVQFTPPAPQCDMPYGFITGAWRGDCPNEMTWEPKPALDDAVRLAIGLRDGPEGN